MAEVFDLRPVIKVWMRQHGWLGVAEVLSYEEVTRYGGYCETCYYEDIEVEIRFRNEDGTEDTYNYYSNFAALIRELEGVIIG